MEGVGWYPSGMALDVLYLTIPPLTRAIEHAGNNTPLNVMTG